MKRLSIIILILLFCAKNLSAQSDSIQNDTVFLSIKDNKQAIEKVNYTTTKWKPNPRTAVLWAIIPGGGQIYNRKYWKVPIVYGGALGLVYGFTWNNQYYVDYRNAYVGMFNYINGTASASDLNYIGNMLPPGKDLESFDKTWLSSVFERKKNFYRRNRDLCIIGAVGVYALTLLDAFVDAQLFDFDISPDLTMNVYPVLDMTMPNTAAVGLQMQFKF